MRETIAPVQSFGEFIRSGRNCLGLTQLEVAILVGVNQGYISRVEKGECEPTITLALKLCSVLKLDINKFASKYI